MVSPLQLRWVKGECVFRCNLPPGLLAEWLGFFLCATVVTWGWNRHRIRGINSPFNNPPPWLAWLLPLASAFPLPDVCQTLPATHQSHQLNQCCIQQLTLLPSAVWRQVYYWSNPVSAFTAFSVCTLLFDTASSVCLLLFDVRYITDQTLFYIHCLRCLHSAVWRQVYYWSNPVSAFTASSVCLLLFDVKYITD